MRVAAAEALWRASRDPAAVATLCDALKDKDEFVRAQAVKALGLLGADAAKAVPILKEVLRN